MVNTKNEKMRRLTWEHGLYCVSAYLKQEGEPADAFAKCCRRRVNAMFWRVPILLWAVGVMCWSTSTFWGPWGMYLLYMTHWGLVLIVLESVLGIIVAGKRSCGGLPDDSAQGLPWIVKLYWVIYNVTIPVSFLITVFYWGILRNSHKVINYAPNPILDVMLHGVNSGVMLLELACSGHPSRLIHIMQPLYFGLAYLLFTVFYWAVGGIDPWGNPFIYPVIDWAKPDQTMVVLTLTAIFLALMHLLVVGVSSLRDVIAKQCRSNVGKYNENLVA